MQSKDIIDKLQLLPHPEGGFYKETYRSDEKMNTSSGKQRNISTAIYYLLENRDKSAFHRIQSDELWFFHSGQPLVIVYILDGQLKQILLGSLNIDGAVPQAVIPANTWFAAKVHEETGYALVSCTVAPGFDFTDFELANRETLLAEFPHLHEAITMFT